MKIRSIFCIGMLLGLLGLLVLGCKESPSSNSSTKSSPTIQYAPQMSNKVWEIRKNVCQDCHTRTYNGSYEAGINMLTKSSMTSGQMQTVYDAMSYEKAPAGYKMADADRDSVRRWAWQNGATAYDLYVPTTLSWTQAGQQSGASNGSDANDAGRYHVFTIEDLYRPTAWIENHTSASPQSLTKNCVTLQDFHTVSQDSFDNSNSPVDYIIPAGLAFNGRLKEFVAGGYLMHNKHMGVFFHSRLLKKGASPNNARDGRTYVRLQINSDYFAFRGKSAAVHDEVETYPWNTAPADPFLVNQPGYHKGTRANYSHSPVDSMFLNDDKYYYVELSAGIVSGKMRYHAKLYTDKPQNGGTMISEIGAERSDPDEAYGGFGFFTYDTNSTGKKDRWAEWFVTASSMHGGGSLPPNGSGCRPPCEYME